MKIANLTPHAVRIQSLDGSMTTIDATLDAAVAAGRSPVVLFRRADQAPSLAAGEFWSAEEPARYRRERLFRAIVDIPPTAEATVAGIEDVDGEVRDLPAHDPAARAAAIEAGAEWMSYEDDDEDGCYCQTHLSLVDIPAARIIEPPVEVPREEWE